MAGLATTDIGTVPDVAVVIPTYRRPDLLARCLDALALQTMDRSKFEIIVCDDGPDESTRTLVRHVTRHHSHLRIRYLPIKKTQGPAGARNAGWRCATAPIIAFTDDDTVPDAGWLVAGARALSRGFAAAGGRIIMPLPSHPSDYETDASRLQMAEFATANAFVLRSALEATGGFDERFPIAWREDSDLHFTLLKHHYRVGYARDAIVVHPLRPAPFAAGLGMQRKVMFDVLLYRKHPRLYRERIRSGPPWLYVAICLSLLIACVGMLAGNAGLALAGAAVWTALTIFFTVKRLSASSFTCRNIVDVLITSIVIPVLSVFWRMVGMARYGTRFP